MIATATTAAEKNSSIKKLSLNQLVVTVDVLFSRHTEQEIPIEEERHSLLDEVVAHFKPGFLAHLLHKCVMIGRRWVGLDDTHHQAL